MHAPWVPNAVNIGGVEKPDLLQALRKRGIRINRAGESLFEDPRFTTLERGSTVVLVAASVAELGLEDGAGYDQVVARARASGLIECPLELGPHLRLRYLNQPEGSRGFPATEHRAPPGSLTVASAPLDDRDDTPKGFYLRRIDGTLWLRGYRSSADHLWHPEDVFIFARSGAAPRHEGPG